MTEYRRLTGIIKPALPMMALAACLSFFTVASSIGLLALSAHLISTAALHPPLAALAVSITGVRFFGISRAICRYGERYVSHKATFQILYELRVWFYRTLEALSLYNLFRYRSGDLLGRIVSDVETLQYFYLRVLAPPAVALATLAGMWWFLGSFSIVLAVLLTFAFLFCGLVVPYMIRRQGVCNSKELLAARSAYKAHLVDTIQGMAELSASAQEQKQSIILAALSGQMRYRQKKAANLAAATEAINSFIMNGTVWGTLVMAIAMAEAGKIEPIYLATITLAVQACFEAVQPLPLAAYMLEESLAAARRLFAIADLPSATEETGEAGLLPQGYDLILEQAAFAYGPQEPSVLEDITFSVSEGQRVAIVGPSGAGKTTLLALLLRFGVCRQGSVTFGGHELAAYEPEELRRYLAVVSQDTHIFNTTIGDNIRIGRPGASDDEVAAAARHAALDSFVTSLPSGFDTQAGLNGQTLSGGQRQRIAIARALLKNAPVFIFDEPTANLDPITEREIMASIKEVTKGRTTILITHRLVGLEDMDNVIVLHKGRIAEKGRADELLAQKGLFYRLWQLQHDVI